MTAPAVHPECQGLLQDVLEYPADDTPRLVMADWLEEHGGLEQERAEFIRLQIDKESAPNWHGFLCLPERLCKNCCRAQALLNGASFWDCLPFPSYQELDAKTFATRDCARLFRRGFVEAVRLPLALWLGHGPRLVREHPLDRVELSDRDPSLWHRPPYGDWYWVRQHGDTGDIEDRLPPALYAHLPPGELEDEDGVWSYFDERAAKDALSAACLAWAVPPRPEVVSQ